MNLTPTIKWSSELYGWLKTNGSVKPQLTTHNTVGTTKRLNRSKINVEELLKDYEFDLDLLDVDDETLETFERWSKLNKAEQIVMCLYAEFRSYRDVGNLLGCSHTTAGKYINQIRKKLCTS